MYCAFSSSAMRCAAGPISAVESSPATGLLQLDGLPYLTVVAVYSIPDDKPLNLGGLTGTTTPLTVRLPVGEYRLDCRNGFDQTPVQLRVQIEADRPCLRFWTADAARQTEVGESLLKDLLTE